MAVKGQGHAGACIWNYKYRVNFFKRKSNQNEIEQ